MLNNGSIIFWRRTAWIGKKCAKSKGSSPQNSIRSKPTMNRQVGFLMKVPDGSSMSRPHARCTPTTPIYHKCGFFYEASRCSFHSNLSRWREYNQTGGLNWCRVDMSASPCLTFGLGIREKTKVSVVWSPFRSFSKICDLWIVFILC